MDLNKKRWQWVVLVILAMIWGTSFILMKKGLNSFTHDQVASFRIFFTFLLFVPFVIRRIRLINRKNLVPILIVGIIGNGIPAFLFTKAETQIDSSMAGILNSLTPLFTLLIGFAFFKAHVKLVNIIGLVLGLMGAVGLIYNGNPFLSGNQVNWYAFFIILATLFYGISVNVIKFKLEEMDSLSIASLAFLIIGPFGGIYLINSDLKTAFETPDALMNLTYIFILSLFSSMIAVVLFNVLIKHSTAIFASSVTYIIPVFAVLWGIFDGESIHFEQVLWIFVILIGVYLVNKQKIINI